MNRRTMAILSYLFYFFIFAIILLIVYLVAFKTDKKVNNNSQNTTTTKIDVKIKLNKENISLKINESIKLKASLYPNNVGSAIFSSSDENVVTVDNNGIIKAVGIGNAKVIVSVNGTGTETVCNVEVVENNVLAKNVFLQEKFAKVKIGDTYQLEATVIPMDASDKAVSYKSSDELIATVNENGLITFLNKGECIITAFLTNKPEIKTEIEFIVKR